MAKIINLGAHCMSVFTIKVFSVYVLYGFAEENNGKKNTQVLQTL